MFTCRIGVHIESSIISLFNGILNDAAFRLVLRRFDSTVKG